MSASMRPRCPASSPAREARTRAVQNAQNRAIGFYILDEPTTGLHSHYVKKLLEGAARAGAQGNTVVVSKHNLEVIKTADW